MEDLNRLTADELIRLHNVRCAAQDSIEGPWKKSKRELIERIRTLGEPEAIDAPAGATETAAIENAKTVGGLVEDLVATDLSYHEIVRIVRERFHDARTTTRSVASVASALRRKGVSIPMRRGTSQER